MPPMPLKLKARTHMGNAQPFQLGFACIKRLATSALLFWWIKSLSPNPFYVKMATKISLVN
jgi:hypothetical protein